jgi:hypothetical protein
MPLTADQDDAILRIKEKSEDDYEKNLVYIAAGTLVLSLTFIEKIVNIKDSNAIWFLILSWFFLSITLLTNLISHQLSSHYNTTCRQLYSDCDDDDIDSMKRINQKAESYNTRLTRINWGTTASLIIGIFLLVIFCSINAYRTSVHKNNISNKIDTMSNEIKPQTHEPDLQKGRTISQPVRPAPSTQPQTKPKTSQPTQQPNTNR